MDSLIKSALSKVQNEKESSKETKKSNFEDNSDTKQFIQDVKIKVIGSGGAGNNTINRLTEMQITDVEFVAMNTDAQDLLYTNTKNKILLGKETTKGLGAGSNPEIGKLAAEESGAEIKKLLINSDINILTCGLGGGTGTGSIPIVAKESLETGALTIAVVSFPFKLEGKRRIQNALNGLESLVKKVDSLIIVPNEKLLEVAPDVPIQHAFKISDEIISNAINGLIELVKKTGLINLDVADIRAILKNSGYAMIGIGEADGKNRAQEAINNAIKNPLLDVEISGATRALINVVGPEDMSLSEVSSAIGKIEESLDESGNLIWGAITDDTIGKKVRVLAIVAGLKEDLKERYFDEYLGNKPIIKKKLDDDDDDLDIEFID